MTKWAQIDIVDWLHFDVKLPQYTDQFLEAQLDGMTLRDGVNPSILRHDLGIHQKRHRRKVMAAITLLREGAPLLSPRARRNRAKGRAGATDNGGASSLINALTEDDDDHEASAEEENTAEMSEREKRLLKRSC